MSLINLLASDNFLVINKDLIKILGLEQAVIMSELCSEYVYWEQQEKLEDDMFFCTIQRLEEVTGLSEYKQRKIFKELQDKELIEINIKGIPATRYVKILKNNLQKILESKSRKIKDLNPEKLRRNNTINNNTINNNNNFLSKDKKSYENSSSTQSTSNSLKKLQQSTNKSKIIKKSNLYEKCLAMIYDFTENKKLQKALISYLDLRLEMKDDKPLYAGHWKGILNKLNKLAYNDISMQIQIVEQSIERSYASVFPVNQGFNNNVTDLPWNIGVKSERYTQEDKDEDAKFLAEMARQGKRTQF